MRKFLLLLICFVYESVSELASSGWIDLPGEFRQVSAKGNDAWAVTTTFQIVRLNGTKWITVKGQATQVAATADGHAWIMNHFVKTDPKGGFSLYNPSTNGFDPLGDIFISYLNAISKTEMVAIGGGVSAGQGGCIKKWNSTMNVLQDQTDCNYRKIVIGDKGVQYKLDQNGILYRSNGQTWHLQSILEPNGSPVSIVDVDVQSADRAVAVDKARNLYLNTGDSWKQIISNTITGMSGNKCVQASINLKSIFCLDNFGGIAMKDIP